MRNRILHQRKLGQLEFTYTMLGERKRLSAVLAEYQERYGAIYSEPCLMSDMPGGHLRSCNIGKRQKYLLAVVSSAFPFYFDLVRVPFLNAFLYLTTLHACVSELRRIVRSCPARYAPGSDVYSSQGHQPDG